MLLGLTKIHLWSHKKYQPRRPQAIKARPFSQQHPPTTTPVYFFRQLKTPTLSTKPTLFNISSEMFSKIAVFIAVFAALVAASPVPGGDNNCNTGPVQCCNSVYQSQSQESSLLHSIVGANLQGVNAMAGVQCTPITVIGAAGGSSWYVSSWESGLVRLIFGNIALSNPSAAPAIISVCCCHFASQDILDCSLTVWFSEGLIVVGCSPVKL